MDVFLKFLYRNKAPIAGTCAVLILLLIPLNLAKDGVIKWVDLKNNKDQIDTLTSLLNTVFLIVATGVAYVKFFKGQIFAHQITATIVVDSFVIPDNDVYLHCIAVQVKNIGSVRVWNPRVSLKMSDFTSDIPMHPKISESHDWSNWDTATATHHGQLLVDPGEEILFFKTRLVAASYFMTSYMVKVVSDSGYVWHFAKNVKNSPS